MEFCSYCKVKIENNNANCSNCGIPLYASEEEKSRYITNIHRTNEKLEEASKAIHKAKWILFLIGLIYLFVHIYLFYTGKIDLADLIFLGGLSSLLIVAGFLTNDRPIPSVIMGIVFVLGIYAYQMYANPINIFQGIIWKILILSSLGYALKSVIELENMIEKNSD